MTLTFYLADSKVEEFICVEKPNSFSVNNFKLRWKELYILHHEFLNLRKRMQTLKYIHEQWICPFSFALIALISYFAGNIYYFVYASSVFIFLFLLIMGAFGLYDSADPEKLDFLINLTDRLLQECDELNQKHPLHDDSLEAFLAWSAMSERILEQKKLHEISYFRQSVHDFYEKDQKRFILEFQELYHISDL